MALLPTLPADLYRDPGFAERELAALFPRTWQVVAHRADLASPDAYLTTDLLGTPLLLARDAAGVLAAHSNVCRHRAGPVAQGQGTRRHFACAYHGWVWSQAGQLESAPEFDLGDLPAHCQELPHYVCAEWGPWIFVRLHPEGPSFADWLGTMAAEVANFGIEQVQFHRTMTYELGCNWKVYIENFLEPYHLARVHPDLMRATDYARYTVDCQTWHSRQVGPARSAEGEAGPGIAISAAGDAAAAWYWAFPNFILNCSFGLISLNWIAPTGPQTCRVVCEFFTHPGAHPVATEAAIATSHAIQLEDITICEAVQRGLGSGSYDRGVLHPTREVGVAHFQRLLQETTGYERKNVPSPKGSEYRILGKEMEKLNRMEGLVADEARFSDPGTER